MMDIRPFSYLKRLSAAALGGPSWRGGPGDIVATLYEDGIILEASASAAEVIGAAGKLAGRSFFDFVRREDRSAVRSAMVYAAENGAYGDPGRLRADFRLLRVRRAAAAAEISFKSIGRGRLAALIRERSGEFAQAREAKISSETRRAATAANQDGAGAPLEPVSADLMADLSHEMKTPLNAIMGFADAMRAETFGPLGDEKYREYAGHIHASGAHLMELIGAALDFAKTETGRYVLNPALTAPGALVGECAEMIRGETEKAGLDLIVRIAPDLPETMIDKRAVKQILINLLTNAVKFTSDGEIEVAVEEKCGALDFTIRDTGIGMNHVMLAKLGGRFSDTHKNGVRGTKGSGLGLSLAYSLARLHGGLLRLDSEPGEGTVARLTLPVQRSLANGALSSLARVASSDVQSQLDRVNAYRRERQSANAA